MKCRGPVVVFPFGQKFAVADNGLSARDRDYLFGRRLVRRMVERREPVTGLFGFALCPYLSGMNYSVFLFFLIYKINTFFGRCGILEADRYIFAGFIIAVERNRDRFS